MDEGCEYNFLRVAVVKLQNHKNQEEFQLTLSLYSLIKKFQKI